MDVGISKYLKTANEINRILSFQSDFFDVVRLVDPIEKAAYKLDADSNKLTENKYNCHSFWRTGKPCINCISMRTINEKKSYNKFEFLDDSVYYIMSEYVEVGDNGYVIEMIRDITNSIMLDGESNDIHNDLIKQIIEFNTSIVTDPLTNVFNRRYFDETLPTILKNYKNGNKDCAFILADIDDFKNINDTYGHNIGDVVLSSVAKCLKENISDLDFVVRFGGDEFFIGFIDIEQETALKRIKEICKRISKIRVPNGNENITVTFSFGMCFLSEIEEPTIDEIIKLSDGRLYNAKQTGKNKVVHK